MTSSRSGGEPFAALPAAAWTIAADATRDGPPRPNHDKLEIVDPPHHGAPFGGFGAGTFARTYRGNFARWHLRTGTHVYRSLPACAQLFSVFREAKLVDAFALGPEPGDGTLTSWRFRTAGTTYRALYPLSWFDGAAASGQLRWRIAQLTPILPHNYRDTSLPVAVFRVHLHNTGEEAITVRAATSWENLSITTPGNPPPTGALHAASAPTETAAATIWLGRQRVKHLDDEEGAFAIAVQGGAAFALPLFDPAGAGDEVWRAMTTAATPALDTQAVRADGRAAAALGTELALAPGETSTVTFSLAWHFPVFSFGGGRRWYRRYTRFYVRNAAQRGPESSACRIARDALHLADEWFETILEWQSPILQSRPPALARALFNSLYILADGGTAWESGEALDERQTPAPEIPGTRDVGRFSILECFTYPYYATLDVRYYGSVPLLYFWPELERQVLLQFAATASLQDAESREMQHVKETVRRKRAGTLPHDLGSPDEDPWVKVNAYDDIDPNRWKDLGPKFVLLVARYLSAVGWEDRGFLRGVWPAVASAMSTLEKQDTDGDGLPENEGIPDQTFDKWPMTGPSAYCSGLALASTCAATEIARWSGNPGKAKSFAGRRRRAHKHVEKKLWQGDTFAFDTTPEGRSMVMTGQLSGEWALAMAGLASAVGEERVRTTLETIWRTCRVFAGDHLAGLRNGASREGGADPDNRHAREVWPGINYPVAALMVLNEMHAEAMELVAALTRFGYEDHPFAFMTPEAWEADGRFRGALYMRALSVWSVEEALRRASPDPDLPSFVVAPEDTSS